MENNNKLLSSDIISIFGTGISEIALLALVYSITRSEIDTSLMVSIRLTASILVFTLIGGLISRFNMRAICISSDFFRAVIIFLAVFVSNIYVLFFISFLLSFLSGLNISIRSVAYQVFVSSEERVAFISKQQFYYGLFSISSPLIAGFLINMTSIRFVFLIESICFLLSITFLFFIVDWGSRTEKKESAMKYGGLEYIIKNNTQRNILLFRISILTAMVSYQVISTYIMTSNYTTIVSLFIKWYSFSFSDLIAYFSFVASISMLFGSYLSGAYFDINKLKKSFFLGSLLIAVGSMLWAMPLSRIVLLFYTLGTMLIFIGLSFLKISLYTSGQELTPEKYFARIISSSDAISRSYQSAFGIIIIWLIPLLGSSVLFVFFAMCSLSSVFVSKKISAEVENKLILK
ncbi:MULTISPECIES: MFS transporter [Photorhabdus]|uniref:Membrane protein n=2 Tax=Photorhabdus asymbiotica TaxID=291112 RepID=C7BJW3_PHOAA|nr:MFS transporter [Photorhabdus asymbiotica]RKS58036.1 MFS transporter [Photorhabdus asymbiotica]CAQ82629.1 putative membrane protein [Photorhabdus asymbiotica]